MNQPPRAPMSQSGPDPAEFNVVCRSKCNLPNRTDSNAALLPYLTHQLGSAHEWSGVWNGPQCPLEVHHNGGSKLGSLNLWKYFGKYLTLGKTYRPKTWRSFLIIYLLKHSNLFTEWFSNYYLRDRPSIIYSVPCDWILQRAYCVTVQPKNSSSNTSLDPMQTAIVR